ncbi:PilZ domain-containing protein [Thermochromatium tepidum]|uniref:PilZ domain-containing protein n=1 Tax=Thermochromatium tepidum ATCC 43061 TaxID=316276 RepID=A0A6I6EE71_THETI|nr:PilZ domain-containing protein [Thermochromatium tepidum]QGU33566.1 PilZ domain-containing protein [Thermochromatium tepidum ATCC 43061]
MLTNDERRGFRRLDTKTDITVTRLATGESMLAGLINLSASGCAFRSEQAIADDEELEILINSPSPRIEPLRRRARVTRIDQDADGQLIAVEFLSQ